MTNEIPRQKWEQFFETISRNYQEWETRVEVLKDDIGAQVLSEGLPLIGFVDFKTPPISAVEIILGEESGTQQTHTIFNPQNIFFKTGEEGTGGIIQIENRRDVKTIIYLIQPIAFLAAYSKPEMLMAV